MSKYTEFICEKDKKFVANKLGTKKNIRIPVSFNLEQYNAI